MNQAVSQRLFIGTFILISGAACISLAPIMVKISPLGPQATAFWRLFLAVPLLMVWAFFERRQADRLSASPSPDATATPSGSSRPRWIWLLPAGLFFTADLACWHAGIIRTSAANATFLSNLTPIVVVAVTWLLSRALPSKGYFWAVAIAICGSLLLSGGAPATHPERLLGDGLSVLTSLFYGLYLFLVSKMRTHMGAGSIMLGTSAVAAVGCLVVTLISGEALFPPVANGQWLAAWWPFLVLAILVQIGGQGLIAIGFGMVPAHVASVLILLQPVLVSVIGWVWLHEILAPAQILGGVLVLVGVWLARRAG